MVTQKLSEQPDQKKINLPEAESVRERDKTGTRIFISIDEEGTLFIDKQPVDKETLGAKLRYMLRKNPDTKVYIRADAGSLFNKRVRWINHLAAEAGAAKILFATLPE